MIARSERFARSESHRMRNVPWKEEETLLKRFLFFIAHCALAVFIVFVLCITFA
jgi:hypothetical protein